MIRYHIYWIVACLLLLPSCSKPTMDELLQIEWQCLSSRIKVSNTNGAVLQDFVVGIPTARLQLSKDTFVVTDPYSQFLFNASGTWLRNQDTLTLKPKGSVARKWAILSVTNTRLIIQRNVTDIPDQIKQITTTFAK
jgi:hypothetical protein